MDQDPCANNLICRWNAGITEAMSGRVSAMTCRAVPATRGCVPRREQLDQLAALNPRLLIDNVSRTGGHLGPNLGVIELTMRLASAFPLPQDTIVFDTGHQAYVHKLLTGRRSPRCARAVVGLPVALRIRATCLGPSMPQASLAWVDWRFHAKHRWNTWTVSVIGDAHSRGGLAWKPQQHRS